MSERAKQSYRLSQFLAGLLILFFTTGQVMGQSVLNDYVQTGLANNQALQQKYLRQELSIQALREAKGLFFPQVSFMADYTLAAGGRAIEFPVGDLLNPVYSTLNELTGSSSFPQVENVNEQFLPQNFHDTKVRIIQPLYNPNISLNHKIKQVQSSVAAADSRAYANELTKEIRTAYFQYLQTEEVIEIYDETEGLLKEILRVNQKLVKEDKATYDAIYRAEFELRDLDHKRAEAKKNQQVAAAYFNFLLNRDLEHAIEIDSSLTVEKVSIQLEEVQAAALINRAEMEQLSQAKLAQGLAVELNRKQYLPKVNLVLDGGFQGFGYNLSDQAYGLMNLSLQWNIFQGNQNKARTEQARIEQRILSSQQAALSQQIELQVQQAWFELQAAEKGIRAALASKKTAIQVLRLTDRKYKEDQASLLELTNAQNQFTQSRLNLAIATYDYFAKQAELEWVAGN